MNENTDSKLYIVPLSANKRPLFSPFAVAARASVHRAVTTFGGFICQCVICVRARVLKLRDLTFLVCSRVAQLRLKTPHPPVVYVPPILFVCLLLFVDESFHPAATVFPKDIILENRAIFPKSRIHPPAPSIRGDGC
jgi:hypothetical protein